MLTVDTWQLGWRPTDINIANYVYALPCYPQDHLLIDGISSFYYPPGKTGNEIGESDPVFMRKYGDAQKNDTGKWIDSSVWHGKAHSWKKIPWLMEQWRRISGGRPFVLKGIQSAVDAVKAAEIGCDGIVVSNHAGRQVDGAVGSLDMLPEIVEAVGDRSSLFL
jgi:isopentenyl diphosphate isomerase/L-lactate dehydrogenase-like FMN-dependent dehydrogenase